MLCAGRINVIHSECPLIDPQRPFVLRDRLVVLAQMSICYSEVHDRGGRVDVIRSECPLSDRLITLTDDSKTIIRILGTGRESNCLQLYKLLLITDQPLL